MTIRQEKTADYDAVREINTVAFGQTEEAELVTKLRQNDHFIPELSIVAEENNIVIGHILFTPIYIGNGIQRYQSLALAPLAVLPEQQGKGVGSALINEGFNKARELGFSSVVVLGYSEYYSRFDFLPAKDFGVHPPIAEWKEAFFVKELKKGSLSEVTGTVSYPPEFDI